MRRPVSEEEFGDFLATFEHTAFRLELQRHYQESDEDESLRMYLAGEDQDPATDPDFAAWLNLIASLVANGKRVERVRVQEDPPTDYQRWERWIGAWNIRAGEQMRYMTRDRAHEIGLLPAAGHTDWWLLDSSRLLTLTFDDEGTKLGSELITDPEIVVQACAWRDLAVHHSTLDQLHGAAA